MDGADRLIVLAEKASTLGCTLLAHNLLSHARDIMDSIDMQRRAFSDDSLMTPSKRPQPQLFKKGG